MSTGIAARAFAKMLREHPVTDMHRADCRGCGECCGIIWLVTDYGGEWGDKWDWNVRAFSDEVMAKECAERHEMRMKRDMDEYDDYCGTAVECVELIDAKVPSRKKEREE